MNGNGIKIPCTRGQLNTIVRQQIYSSTVSVKDIALSEMGGHSSRTFDAAQKKLLQITRA